MGTAALMRPLWSAFLSIGLAYEFNYPRHTQSGFTHCYVSFPSVHTSKLMGAMVCRQPGAPTTTAAIAGTAECASPPPPFAHRFKSCGFPLDSLYCRYRGYSNGRMFGWEATSACVAVVGGAYNGRASTDGWGRMKKVWCERKSPLLPGEELPSVPWCPVCRATSFTGGRVADSHSGSTGTVSCNAGYARVQFSLSCTGRPSSWSPTPSSSRACRRSKTAPPHELMGAEMMPVDCPDCAAVYGTYGTLAQRYDGQTSQPSCQSGAVNVGSTSYSCTSSGAWSPTPNRPTLCRKRSLSLSRFPFANSD